MDQTIRLVGLFCGGLTAGIALCVLLADRVFAGTGQFYTEMTNLMSRALSVPAPALGALGLVAMSAHAALVERRGGGAPFWLSIGAVALGLTAILITRFGHFPINAQVRGWNPASPPDDWMRVQEKWAALHAARTAVALGSFTLFLTACILR